MDGMNPRRQTYYRTLFRIAAAYDLALGIVFTFFPGHAFQMLDISDKRPQFGGYVALLGAFVFVIGVAYYLISRGDLRRNLDLILVGVLYKMAYCGIAFHYWFGGELPHVVFGALFGVADLIFFALMAECYWSVKGETTS
jgi:formate/nitrite transporter FocA (FNT family)